MTQPGTESRKALVIGLDGATFDLLRPWMEEGLLPHMKRLMEKGVSGELDSTIPPTTPPAWASCVTGKNPGKHGIFDFRESPLADHRRPLISGSSVKSAKIWHLLNGVGKKTIIVNVPITYPPEAVDGLMISGLMTPGADSPYASPITLKDELKRAIGDYVPNVDIPRYDVELKEDALRFLRDIRYCFEKRRDAFFYLMDRHPWDYFMIVFILHDRIQHLFWKYLDPSSRFYSSKMGPFFRERIIDSYQCIDEMLGTVEKRLDENTDLYILSDHGFGPTRQWFNVNKWLADLGLLKVESAERWKKAIFYRLMVLNESQAVKSLVPDWVQSRIRGKIRGGRSTFKTDIDQAIDWENTKAFFASIPSQGIFVNIRRDKGPGIVEPGEAHQDLRNLIRDRLLELRDPASGEKLVERVFFREEIYSGPQTCTAPDVLFVAQNYATLGRQLLGASEWVRTSETTPNGFHRPNGIFIAVGKGVRSNGVIDGAAMIDFTPTILYSMGLPVPKDMDGKVLTEVFYPDYVAGRPIEYEDVQEGGEREADGEAYSEVDEEKVRERLKSLGYIE